MNFEKPSHVFSSEFFFTSVVNLTDGLGESLFLILLSIFKLTLCILCRDWLSKSLSCCDDCLVGIDENAEDLDSRNEYLELFVLSDAKLFRSSSKVCKSARLISDDGLPAREDEPPFFLSFISSSIPGPKLTDGLSNDIVGSLFENPRSTVSIFISISYVLLRSFNFKSSA